MSDFFWNNPFMILPCVLVGVFGLLWLVLWMDKRWQKRDQEFWAAKAKTPEEERMGQSKYGGRGAPDYYECATCSAHVASSKKHHEWHTRLEKR